MWLEGSFLQVGPEMMLFFFFWVQIPNEHVWKRTWQPQAPPPAAG